MILRHLLNQRTCGDVSAQCSKPSAGAAGGESLNKLYLCALQIIKSTNKSGCGDVEGAGVK